MWFRSKNPKEATQIYTNKESFSKAARDKPDSPQSGLSRVLATESVMGKKVSFPEAAEKYLEINLMRNACDLYKGNYKILLVK